MTNQPINDQDRGIWTSASSAEADSLCPGRHKAQLGLPDIKSEDAQAGTNIHAWLHWQRTGGKGPEPACDYETADRCWQLECKAVSLWIERLSGDPDFHPETMQMFSEQRSWFIHGDYRHSGQADCAMVAGAYVLILDTKTGWKEVTPPASNRQLRDLAVLFAQRCPVRPCKVATVMILQPKGEQQPPCVYSEQDLMIATAELCERMERSNAPDAKRIPGEVQCQFCKAKGTSRCPESQEAVNTLAVEKVLVGKEIAEIPSPQLLHACILAGPIIKTVMERAREILEKDPNAIPGFGLKANAPNKPISNPQELWRRCASQQGLTLEEFMRCISVTKGDLEETLKEKIRAQTGQKRVQGWGKTWEALLDGITTEEPKKPSVVRL